MKVTCAGLFLLLIICSSPAEAAKSDNSGVQLAKVGTEQAYFTHNGKPLLSFGGLSDFIFYAAKDAYGYELWADWAAEHGINHVRAYPPLSWKYIEYFARENGGSKDNVLFPYEQASLGSRQFDLRKFNEAYWKRFRCQLEYLQSKGIIVHLLMWNGWQLRAGDDFSDEQGQINWSGHFFNPDNNVNSFTDHLGGNLDNRFKIYHSVADHKAGLVEAQKAWFLKLLETTADLDNVYYDLVHEIAEHHSDWTKNQSWIEEMALTVRNRWAELQPNRAIVIGMDTGGLDDSARDWIFTRPYFDLLIYGKVHKIENAKQWRIRYKKPYIPQEGWDDDGEKYSYMHPEQRNHTRKYMWKFMMAKCQQMDIYMKKRPSFSENLPKYPHNYDPRGLNKFEDDALVLRRFWEQLIDYPNLWFNGRIESGPGSHKYVLSSAAEAIAYCSSATAKENVKYEAQVLKIDGLSLADGNYKVEIVNPVVGVVQSQTVSVKAGGVDINLPEFTDDIAVHIY